MGVGEGPPAKASRRTLFTDDRGTGLRVTWRAERGLVVLSLWRDDVCRGTFRMPLAEASRLADFLADHAALDAATALDGPGSEPAPGDVSAARAR